MIDTETIEQKEQRDITIENLPTVSDDLSILDTRCFARLLGKTEDGLKNEFYLYKVKELMRRVGLKIENAKSQKDIEQKISLSKSTGVEEVFITPFYHSVLMLIKPADLKGLRFCVAVDYPLGEQSVKQKVVGVKEACKKRADYVFCSVASDSVKLSCFGDEKRKILKSRRASKKPFGIIVSAKIDVEDLQKIIKNTDGLRADSIIIDGTDTQMPLLIKVLTTANGLKGKRKVHVLAGIKTADELATLIDASADKVYTPYAFMIGQELIAKAQLTTQ